MCCRKVMGKAKAATAAASARQEVTLALSQPLPALLRKFQTEPRKARTQCTPSLTHKLAGSGLSSGLMVAWVIHPTRTNSLVMMWGIMVLFPGAVQSSHPGQGSATPPISEPYLSERRQSAGSLWLATARQPP